jgi:hypothetical protein
MSNYLSCASVRHLIMLRVLATPDARPLLLHSIGPGRLREEQELRIYLVAVPRGACPVPAIIPTRRPRGKLTLATGRSSNMTQCGRTTCN